MNPAEVGMRHIEAYGGTLLARIFAALATLSLHLLIARSVTPSEYGAVAFLVTTLSILLLFLSFGNEPLLVREGGAQSPRALSVVVFTLLFALLFAMVLSMFAVGIERALHIPGLGRMLLWGLPALPLQAMQILPRAELLRKQEFRRLARTDARSSILAWLPAIAFFLVTKDMAAFALYLVTMHLLRVFNYWRKSGLRPGVFAGQHILLGRYLSGWRIFSIDSSTFLTTRFDDLVVAWNLGAAMLGIYHLCYRVITVAQEFFSGVMRVLSYPRYALAAPDRAHVYRLFCADTRFVTAIMLPVLSAAFVTADILLPLLLGSAWTGAVFIFRLLTLEAMRQSLLSLGAQGLIALGDERRLLRFSLVSAVVLLPTYILLSFTDLRTFVTGFVAVNTVLNVYFFQVLRSSFIRPLRPLLLTWLPGLIGSLSPLVFTIVLRVMGVSNPWLILSGAGVGLLIVFISHVLLVPDIFRSMRLASGLSRNHKTTDGLIKLVVYVDGPFDDVNPHLHRVYKTMQSFSPEIEIRPLHFRTCLREGWKRLPHSGRSSDHSFRILHMHYPVYLYEGESLARAVKQGLRNGAILVALRALGFRFVFTLHDSGAHDFPYRRWELFYLTVLCQSADVITTLSEEGRRLLFTFFGRSQGVRVARHCSYEPASFSEQRRRTKREELGISADEQVFLLFGNVKPYKGYDMFVRSCEAAAAERTDPDARRVTLLCAGKGMAQFAADTALGNARRIILDRFIDQEEISALMDAADFGALPYRRILHSGTAMLYASHACPVIAPRMGVFIDHQRDYNIGLYYNPDSMDDLEAVINRAIELGRNDFASSFPAFHSDHRLEDEAQAMQEVYRSLSGKKVLS
jgi:O-antigen/teichoic acid export membrane protein